MMNNHPFLKSIQSSDGSLPTCAFCGGFESSHPPFIECQVCGQTDYCISYMTLMMCNNCKDNETKLQAISQQQAAARVTESHNITDTIERKINEPFQHDNVTEVIKLQTDYFNAETLSFTELHKLIPDNYEYACAVQARIEHLQNTLLPNNRKQGIELQNELYAAQRILNDTVYKIQIEKRKEFSTANINYPSLPPAVSKEKKVKLPSIKSRDPIDRLVAIYLQQMEKRGTPIEPMFESYHNGELLYKGKDHSIAEIKAKESGGIVKTITAFDRAKQIITQQTSQTESND